MRGTVLRSPCRGFALVLAAVVSVGCPADDDAGPSGARFAILGGTLDTDPANDGVVAIYDTAGGFCTGTLIGRRAVAMQAFCMHGSPTDLSVLFGPSITAPTATVAVEDVVLHPDYDPAVVDSPQLAVALLAADPPAGVLPIPPLPAALGLTDADEGALLTFLGYGPTTQGGMDAGTRRTVDAPLTEVCVDETECGGRTDLVYVDVAAGGPCTSDGPGFLERGGTRYLAALIYAGDENCTEFGIGLSIGAYESFLAEFVDAGTDADADAETDAGTDAETDADVGADVEPEAAADAVDSSTDAGADAPADAAAETGEAEAGADACDCSAPGTPGNAPAGALLALLGALLVVRRRR